MTKGYDEWDKVFKHPTHSFKAVILENGDLFLQSAESDELTQGAQHLEIKKELIIELVMWLTNIKIDATFKKMEKEKNSQISKS